MPGGLLEIVISFKFRQNRLNGFWDVGVEICHILAFSACWFFLFTDFWNGLKIMSTVRWWWRWWWCGRSYLRLMKFTKKHPIPVLNSFIFVFILLNYIRFIFVLFFVLVYENSTDFQHPSSSIYMLTTCLSIYKEPSIGKCVKHEWATWESMGFEYCRI